MIAVMEANPRAIKNILARNIKRHRGRLGLTQEEASERADITVAYWQRLELTSQVDLPSLPALFRIARALNVKPFQLLKE